MTREPSNPRARGIEAKLTAKQRRLIDEIEEIAVSIKMDYWNILDYAEGGRTVILELMKRQLVRSEIIMRYTLIDEFLTEIICYYYFKTPKKQFSYENLWRTNKFQIFAHYFMDETYLLKKMTIVNAIKEIPSPIKSTIARINDVRNAIAHSFFPENRRQYKSYKKVMYKNADIFTNEGITKFLEDVQSAQDYLIQRQFGVYPADVRAEMENE
jgi:hypothetical protein